MKMNEYIRAGVVTLATIVGASAAAGRAEAQVTMGTAEAVASKDTTYVRAQIASDLPGKVGQFSFLELYGDGSYFGKSMFSRDLPAWITGNGLAGKITAESEIVHFMTPASQVGVGVGVKIPVPHGYGKVKLLDYIPAWTNKETGSVINQVMAGYSFGAEIGRLNFGGFGYYDLTNKEWNYGEFELTADVGKHFEVGLNPMITKDQGLVPRVILRVKK